MKKRKKDKDVLSKGRSLNVDDDDDEDKEDQDDSSDKESSVFPKHIIIVAGEDTAAALRIVTKLTDVPEGTKAAEYRLVTEGTTKHLVTLERG